MLATSFETFERQIRDQLGRTLGPGGFDPARDITAITVNRWPHGYAYEYNPLFDPDWDEHNQPHVIGRQPFRADRHRKLGFRRGGLYGLGDRPGLPSGGGGTGDGDLAGALRQISTQAVLQQGCVEVHEKADAATS